MSRSRLHAPRCCFDTHPQLQRRTTHAVHIDALLCRRPTSMPQLYHRWDCCVNVFCKTVSANVKKVLPVQHPPSVSCWRWCKLCSPWHQALTACGLVVAALCGLHRVRTACWKCRWLTVVIFLSVGWWVYNYAGYPPWTTPAPIICRDIAGIIIYCGLFYPAKITLTQNAGNPSKIKHLAPFAAIDLKSVTFEKHRLINSYPQLIHRYIP